MKGLFIFVAIVIIVNLLFDNAGWTEDDEFWDCPFCNSSNTDGNHCDDCGGDF